MSSPIKPKGQPNTLCYYTHRIARPLLNGILELLEHAPHQIIKIFVAILLLASHHAKSKKVQDAAFKVLPKVSL